MKARLGFVSNSSSSSFIIGSKRELSKEDIAWALGIHKVKNQKLAYNILSKIVETLFDNLDEQSVEDRAKEYGESVEEHMKGYGLNKQQIKKYKNFYTGAVSNDSNNPIEVMLVDLDLDYEDENIITKKEAGF